MSLIKDLFNRKKQLKNTNYPDKNRYPELDEEDPEDEEIEPEFKDNPEAFEDTSDQDIEYEVVEREIQPAKIICPDCGGITLEGLEFCDKCGGELL